MKFLAQIALCCLFAGGAMAQRGGHAGGGGFGGHAGGSMRGFGGASVGGFRGGGGYRGVGGYGGFRGGFSYGGFGYGGYWPYYGLGYGYWPGYYDYDSPYLDDPYTAYPYATPAYGYGSAGHGAAPTPVYQPPAPTYVAHPVIHEYDQYGQEIRPPDAASASSGSPSSGTAQFAAAGPQMYLIAFQDHTIQAVAAYWVDGKTLHYVTLQHEEKQAPLDTVDRTLSSRLNAERRVQFALPAQ